MKKAKNKEGRIVNILQSKENEEYFCIACNKPLVRAYGDKKKYFRHEQDVTHFCDNKITEILKTYKEPIIIKEVNQDKKNIVKKEIENAIPKLEHLENGYNKQQWESIIETDGYNGICGVSGGGKSKSLIGKIEYLIKEKGVDPNRILCISFTNKVVKELVERLYNLIGEDSELVNVYTMHSLCYNLLKKYSTEDNLRIISDWQIQSFFTKVMKLDKTQYLKEWKPNDIMSFINIQKSKMCGYDNLELDNNMEFMRRELSVVFKKYENYKQELKSIDFSDMLYLLWKKLKENTNMTTNIQGQYDYILFDEYNDANDIQLDIIRIISELKQNVTFYFDARQSIYSFNGSNINLTLDFLKIFPQGKLMNFYYNYRSTQDIIKVSNRIISSFKHDLFYPIEGVKKEKGETQIHSFENVNIEGKFIADKINDMVKNKNFKYNDFFIISRTNARSNSIEEMFIKNKIPYYRKNSVAFMERREIKDILSYLKVVQNNSSKEIERILNVPNRYLGKEAISLLTRHSNKYNTSIYNSLVTCNALSNKIYWVKGAKQLYSKIIHYSKYKYKRLSDLIDFIVNDLNYYEYLKKSVSTEEVLNDKIENLKSFANMANDFGNLDGLIKHFDDMFKEMQDVNKASEKVDIMTIHGSKGLENKVCFVLGFEDTVLPHKMSKDLEEERRMAFVACSRAKDNMYITYTENHYLRDEPVMPSEFLEGLDSIINIYEH